MAACAHVRGGSSPRGRAATARVAGTRADSTHRVEMWRGVQARVVL